MTRKNAKINSKKTIAKVNVEKAFQKRKEFLSIVENDLENASVHISKGNSKLGVIPSFSVLPLITCKNCGDCSKYCYAAKGNFNFNRNILNLSENTALLKSSPEKVEKEINYFLNNSTTLYRYFRWNTAGDIFSLEYLEMIVRIAKNNPFTTFLAFTKNFELLDEYVENGGIIPENLTVVFSRWGNTEIKNRNGFPVAIVKIDESTNIPENAFRCNGDCQNCLECWKAKKNTYRFFELH